MPNYDYECQSCEQVHEVFQSMKDAPLDACPQCGAGAPRFYRKIGTGAGIVFKGSGFYETDYKKPSSSEGSSSGKESKVDSSASSGCGKPACCAENN